MEKFIGGNLLYTECHLKLYNPLQMQWQKGLSLKCATNKSNDPAVISKATSSIPFFRPIGKSSAL